MEQNRTSGIQPSSVCPQGAPSAEDDLSTEAPPEARATAAWVSLDRRVIQLWRINGLIGCAIIAIPALAGLLFTSYSLLGNSIFALVLWTGLLVFGCASALWYPVRAYGAWGYRVEEQVLEIRSGVWFRVVRLLPLSRLQHVDLHRGPLERAYGLASLSLHTAGTREASLGIPGLADAVAERLRDQLAAVGGDDAV